MDHRTLLKHAREAKKRSHSPYSHFRVGAALLTGSGKVFTGCNIEISTYALTLCAERTAIFKARSEGFTEFTSIAIATDHDEFIPPCGACRQVLMDLGGNLECVLSTRSGRIQSIHLKELLPMAFGPAHLSKKQRKK